MRFSFLEAGEDVFDLEVGSDGTRDKFADDLIEFAIGADDGIGIDRKIDGGLANGGSLSPGRRERKRIPLRTCSMS